jgi:dUTP pyrophosphatase
LKLGEWDLMDKQLSFSAKRGFEKISFHQWSLDTMDFDVFSGDESFGLDDVKLPQRSTKYSAGYDIFSPIEFTLRAGEDIKIPLGWKVYMLHDELFQIFPRSGLGFKFYTRLANTVGIVDSDYYNNEKNEGHCWIKLRNESDELLYLGKDEAIAQGIFLHYLLADGDSFEFGNKRRGGFGSTDR